ncbi:MAG: dienelactone hydrolase family protein [Rhodospirillales bacterium]
MAGNHIRIASSGGGGFDCYVAAPAAAGRVPALVIMSSVFGVDGDVQGICEDIAAAGFLAAAPDLFWRGDKGPMDRSEDGQRRARERAADRERLIEQGVGDLADTVVALRRRPDCSGRVAVAGLCYGGPYAILGPVRAGCDAGLSFHGTNVDGYLADVAKVRGPLVLHWGDEDHAAPPEALARVRAATAGMPNAEVVVYPGVKHGYTARTSPAWNADAAAASWRRTVAVLKQLRDQAAAAAQ